ncbi:MAG: hypothetical protein LBE56_00800 [Tannerella sp.]|jgi:hypothetical protein|nr:hypothetical protein [Tannerella sp.]
MKKLKVFCNAAVILLFAGLSVHTVVAQTTKKETITKVYGISQTGNLDLLSYSSYIEILTWDANEVKVTRELAYEDNGNREDIEKLLEAFKNMDAESSSKDLLKLKLNLVQSSQTNNFFLWSNYKTVLCNGEVISMDANKIKVTYTIWIPSTLNVKVDSRFGKFKMASIRGNVNFTMSNNDLEMGDFGESGTFDIRFSSAKIGRGGAAKFSVHNSTINAGELKNVTAEARFSKFNIAKAESVSIDSHNTTSIFGLLNDIDATARFSTIRIENNVTKSKLDFYNSDLFGANFQTMEIGEARFSKFNAGNIDVMITNSINNSTCDLDAVNTFSCREARFSTFVFDEISGAASLPDANNTTVRINNTGASFKVFSGNFRFGEIYLKLNRNVVYNLNYEGTFSQLNGISRDKFKSGYVSDTNGPNTTVQGLNTDASCNISLVVSNTTCKIE